MKRVFCVGVFFFVLLWGFSSAFSAVLTVTSTADSGPGSLREAIGRAGAGDTITFSLPAQSVITLGGGALLIEKNLTIDGLTVSGLTITANGSSRVFSVVGAQTIVNFIGLKIVNGHAPNGFVASNYSYPGGEGGGIVSRGALTLTRCTLANNSAGNGVDAGTAGLSGASPGGSGGGIYSAGAVTLSRCILAGNSAGNGGAGGVGSPGAFCVPTPGKPGGSGGGIYSERGVTLTNCILSNNSAGRGGGTNCPPGPTGSNGSGGGIYSERGVTLTNCTLYGNTANGSPGGSGGGIYSGTDGSKIITNSIFWHNGGEQIAAGTASVTYSLIEGGYSGEGNLNEDPLFVDPSKGDFHLQQNSPCVDAGHGDPQDLPETDLDGNPRIVEARVDMGAYESPFYKKIAGTGILKGRVLGPRTMVANVVLVTGGPGSSNPITMIKQQRIGSTGSFVMVNVQPGTYSIYITRPGSVERAWFGPVSVTADRVTEVKIALFRDWVSGRIWIFARDTGSTTVAAMAEGTSSPALKLTKILDYDAQRELQGYYSMSYNEAGDLGEFKVCTADGDPLSYISFGYNEDGTLSSLTFLDSSKENLMEERFFYEGGLLIKVEDYISPGYLLGYEELTYKKEVLRYLTDRDDSNQLLGSAKFIYKNKGFLSKLLLYSAGSKLEGQDDFTYDSAGRLAEERYYEGKHTLVGSVKHEYDSEGNEIRESHYDSGGLVSEVIYQYDTEGVLREATIVDPTTDVSYVEFVYE